MKKIFLKGTIIIAVLACMFIFSGCFSVGREQLVNTKRETLDNIDSITVIYSAEKIKILRSTSDELVLKEYMSIDNEDYYSITSKEDGTLYIKQGDRNKIGLSASIEVFIPEDYSGDLNLQTTSGKIEVSSKLDLSSFEASTSSGKISTSSIKADEVTISSTSGKVEADNVTANNCKIATTSGKIEIGYKDIQKFVAKSTSGKIEINLISNFNGNFEADTVSGKIETKFDNELSGNSKKKSGDIGKGNAEIQLSTTSGKIEVN